MPKLSLGQRIIVDVIKRIAAQLGRRPTEREFAAKSPIGARGRRYLEYFQSWNDALRAAGFVPNPYTFKVRKDDLLRDWARVARKQKRVPTVGYYRRWGKYASGSMIRRFGAWSRIPEWFREFANDTPEWADVLALLPAKPAAGTHLPQSKPLRACGEQPKLPDRPTYGNRIDFRGISHEPTNENGVVFLFGMVARELGYIVEGMQPGFPDCEAKIEIAQGRWQRVYIEFEYESRNFRDHRHPVNGCDVIVCWHHIGKIARQASEWWS